ncbi:MAG TPA: hypothetical protein PJ984_03780 [Candidatus Saccharibacteria bacterium]|nr:hypothetical protein [Patescibacteria group bacterium]HMS31488.1 hypothetical protein [Candidatus Saccharibacteria bacterium]
MDDLRIYSKGHQAVWTKSQLKCGFLKFYDEFKRFPTAHEIDAYKYLPSARSIQRSYGGLVALRKEILPLGTHLDHTKGLYRSNKAREAGNRSQASEEDFYNKLANVFEEIAIHEHKIIRPGGVASDFFIYLTPDSGVVIDIFYAQDLRTLGSIVNIKLKRYSSLPFEIYFVCCDNPIINNRQITSLMLNRRVALPDHIKVVNDEEFFRNTVADIARRSYYVLN